VLIKTVNSCIFIRSKLTHSEIVYLYAAKSRTHAIPCQLRIGLLTDTVTFIPDASTRLDNVDLVFDRDCRLVSIHFFEQSAYCSV
jgi:hypothetical protein